MDFLFDMNDVAYLERGSMDGLKREKWKAELELHSAEFWDVPDDIVFWTEYLEAVKCAMAEKQRKYRESHPVPAYGPGISADDVKERLDIVDIIGQYTDLRKSGNRFTGKCTLHDDKHPSMFVFPDRQRWHCFQCNQGGDVFDFIQKYDNIDFKTALNQLAGVG